MQTTTLIQVSIQSTIFIMCSSSRAICALNQCLKLRISTVVRVCIASHNLRENRFCSNSRFLRLMRSLPLKMVPFILNQIPSNSITRLILIDGYNQNRIIRCS